MKIERTDKSVLCLRFKGKSDFEQEFLFRTDVHHDSTHCDRTLEKKHLDEALERNALIVDNGDMYDVMQSVGDRRGAKSAIRKELLSSSYLDDVIEENVEFLKPYAKNFVLMAHGNHETAILKYKETDITQRTIALLNHITGSKIEFGGYRGWLKLMFELYSSKSSIDWYYHHGQGGSAPVTKGVIQSARRAAYIDADLITVGHIHEEWSLSTMRAYVTCKGIERKKEVMHIQGATYKDGWEGSWEQEKGFPPPVLGAWWIKFKHNYAEGNNSSVTMEVQRAK